MIAFPSSPSGLICTYFLFFSIVFYANRDLIISASGISSEERSIILQEHNRLRQLVATGRYPGQPGAENMREIVWDDELAARAQQWADNCQFRHDPHRTISKLFAMSHHLPTPAAPPTPPIQSNPSQAQSRHYDKRQPWVLRFACSLIVLSNRIIMWSHLGKRYKTLKLILCCFTYLSQSLATLRAVINRLLYSRSLHHGPESGRDLEHCATGSRRWRLPVAHPELVQ